MTAPAKNEQTMTMATDMAPAKACLLMDQLLLFATAAAMYPAKILVTGQLFGIAEAIVMAPAKKQMNNGNGNQQGSPKNS